MNQPDRVYRHERATRTKIASVRSSADTGRAACTDVRDLFDLVEGVGDAKATYTDRLEAARLCDGCPLAATCGFRVIPTGVHPKRRRAALAGAGGAR
jgi:hypothetical protein